jgi:hypothetical protein
MWDFKNASSAASLLILVSCGATDVSSPGERPIDTNQALQSSMPASIRNAEQLRATFSELTGVPLGLEDLSSEFADTSASLPMEGSLEGAGFSTQLGVVRFAAAYCNFVFINSFRNWPTMLERRRLIVTDAERELATAAQVQNFWNSARANAVVTEMLSQYWGPDRPGLGLKRAEHVSEMLALARQLASGENNNRDVLAGLCTAALSSYQVTSL